MAGCILVETVDEKSDTSLVSEICSVSVSPVAGGKRQDSIAENWAQFDLFGHAECELARRICAVEPSTKVLCVVMDQQGLMVRQGLWRGRIGPDVLRHAFGNMCGNCARSLRAQAVKQRAVQEWIWQGGRWAAVGSPFRAGAGPTVDPSR